LSTQLKKAFVDGIETFPVNGYFVVTHLPASIDLHY